MDSSIQKLSKELNDSNIEMEHYKDFNKLNDKLKKYQKKNKNFIKIIADLKEEINSLRNELSIIKKDDELLELIKIKNQQIQTFQKELSDKEKIILNLEDIIEKKENLLLSAEKSLEQMKEEFDVKKIELKEKYQVIYEIQLKLLQKEECIKIQNEMKEKLETELKNFKFIISLLQYYSKIEFQQYQRELLNLQLKLKNENNNNLLMNNFLEKKSLLLNNVAENINEISIQDFEIVMNQIVKKEKNTIITELEKNIHYIFQKWKKSLQLLKIYQNKIFVITERKNYFEGKQFFKN